MKKITRTIFWGLVAGLILTGASIENAEARGKGRGRGRGDFGPRMAAQLNLTAEQQAEIKRLRQAMQKELASVHQALDQLRNEKHQIRTSGQSNEEAMLTLEQKMEPLRTQIRERRKQFRQAVINILTPEQRATHEKLMKSRKNRGQRRGMGQGPQSRQNFER